MGVFLNCECLSTIRRRSLSTTSPRPYVWVGPTGFNLGTGEAGEPMRIYIMKPDEPVEPVLKIFNDRFFARAKKRGDRLFPSVMAKIDVEEESRPGKT